MEKILKNMVICFSAGAMLAACGGDSSNAGSDAKLLANGEACNATWTASAIYVGGNKASYSGVNYTAAYWTQGNNPSTNNGPAGSGQPWVKGFTCGAATTTTTSKATTTTTKATTTTTKATTTSTAATSTTTTKASTTTTKATTSTTLVTTTSTKATTTSTAATTTTTLAAGKYQVIGYYPGWTSSTFPVNATNIDAKKLSVINYAFVDICWGGQHGNAAPDGGGLLPCKDASGAAINPPNGTLTFGDASLDPTNLNQLVALKSVNPGLKIVPSVGGWTWSNRFSDMANTAATRTSFINSTVAFIRQYKLDGIDLDWEYPTSIGIPCATGNTCQRSTDKQNFVTLAQGLRTAFDAAGATDGKHYIITIASGSNSDYVTDPNGSSAWIVQLATSLDWINIMTYDFHGPWDAGSGFVAPLYSDPASPSLFDSNDSVNIYLAAGVAASKLSMGVPFYGYGWVGCSAGSGNGLYQPCTGAATTGSDGSTFNFSYLVSQGYLKKDAAGAYTIGGLGYTRYWNSASQVPYLYNASTKIFITYDDEASVHAKDAYIKSKGLRGGMFWELNADSNKTLGTVMSNDLPH